MLISTRDIITASVSLYKKHFRTYLIYIGLSFIPAILAILTKIGAGIAAFFATVKDDGIHVTGWSWSPLILGFIILGLLSLVGLIIQILFIRTADMHYHNTIPDKVMPSLKQAYGHFWQTLGVSILVALFTGLPLFTGTIGWVIVKFIEQTKYANSGSPMVLSLMSVLFGLLALYGMFHAIYFSVRLLFAIYEIILYKEPIRAAMQQSLTLTKGRWWPVFWRMFVPSIVFYTIAAIVAAVLTKILGLFISNLTLIGLVELAVNVLVVPLIVLSGVILYDNVKTLGPEAIKIEEPT